MSMKPFRAFLVAMAAAVVFGFVVTGGLLIRNFRDVEPSAYPFGHAILSFAQLFVPDINRVAGPVWMVGTLLAFSAAVFYFVRASVRAQASNTSGANSDRRRFLGGAVTGTGAAVAGLLAAGGAGFSRAWFGLGNGGRGWQPVMTEVLGWQVTKTHPEWKDEWKESRVEAHRRLGRTGWEVSDIVLGASGISGEAGVQIVERALERGVNYIDTAPDYSVAGSEKAVGEAVQGRRNEIFLATKFCTPHGNLPTGTPVAEYKKAVEASLKRLRTDRVDLIHVHGCDSVARLMDPNVHEAFDRLKQEGKARFMGFSSHTPNLVDVANAAIESNRFDVMMLAYHHGIWPSMPEVIARARREIDMGIVAMKTLKGAKHRGLTNFQPHADAYSQAALKWVLSNQNVSCAIISFFELQHVDEYLAASGRPFSMPDQAVLEAYDAEIAGRYCAPHCGDCLDSCPEGLPINDVLRHRMYFEDYGWEKEAMRLYAQFETKASVCVGCSAPCAGACPLGIPIKEQALGAHELLTLA
jgi:aryl-alcohol dehydrogenase-like predicted oxidoreductase